MDVKGYVKGVVPPKEPGEKRRLRPWERWNKDGTLRHYVVRLRLPLEIASLTIVND